MKRSRNAKRAQCIESRRFFLSLYRRAHRVKVSLGYRVPRNAWLQMIAGEIKKKGRTA
jgi:hypothetical protein